MKGLIVEIIVFLALVLMMVFAYECKAEEMQEVRMTCYCPESCPGTITASGATVREGILACSREHLGQVAMLYTLEGDLIGIYECLDTGGSKGLKAGTQVDVWKPSLTEARKFIRTHGERVLVKWVDGKG